MYRGSTKGIPYCTNLIYNKIDKERRDTGNYYFDEGRR
jgi:hypothetical protein